MKPAAGAVVEAATRASRSAGPGARQGHGSRGQLTLIRPDGTEGGSHPLHRGENLVGRGQGHLFRRRPLLVASPCRICSHEAGLEVRDLRSLNGVFVKAHAGRTAGSGDTLRIGQELLRSTPSAHPPASRRWNRDHRHAQPRVLGPLVRHRGRDVDGPAFPLFDETVVLGREARRHPLSEDGYVSGTHAQITLRDGRVYLTDLGSSERHVLRVRDARVVPSGSLLLMGQQLFRLAHQ